MSEAPQPHPISIRGTIPGVAFVVLLVAGCDSDDSIVELGRIEFYDNPAVIEAPASIAVNEQFLVRVMSYGGGCISFDRTDVELSKVGADFLPFDRRDIPGENEACTSDLRVYPHEATLSFDTIGTKTIRIHGRRVDIGVDEPIEIPLTLVVN